MSKEPTLDELLDPSYTPPTPTKKRKRKLSGKELSDLADPQISVPISTLYALSRPIANVWVQTRWECTKCGTFGFGTPQLGAEWDAPAGIRLWKEVRTPISDLPFRTELSEECVPMCPHCTSGRRPALEPDLEPQPNPKPSETLQ